MKDHCVIGALMHGRRTWCANEEEAAAHARKLIKQGKTGEPLFIVKLVKVVELAAPPTVVREPLASDTEES